MVPAFSWKARDGASVFLEGAGWCQRFLGRRGIVPAFSWKAVQRRPGLPASGRIASEGDGQNGRIVVKLVAIGQTNATIWQLSCEFAVGGW
jgi:hypothetical protein